MNTIRRFFIEGYDFLNQIYLNRYIIWELTKRDFSTKYVKNIFGLSWAILEPMAMMVILWFIFTFVRTGRNTDVPFALFLLTGLIAYDFINKSLNSATRSISAYGFLINKVNFRSAFIPIVKILSEVYLHIIILGIVGIILILNGIPVRLSWLQVIYYLFSAIMFLIGLTWLTSSISLFFPDINYIITITMRVLFFFTPIFWDASMVPEEFMIYFKLNPMYYIVSGYRDAFLYNVSILAHPSEGLYFWSLTLIFLFLGVYVFRKLRPHFADLI